MKQKLISAAVWLLWLVAPAGPLAAPSATDQVIKFYQSRIAKDADDAFNYAKLGAAYVQKARETGDVTFYDLGERALRKSLELAPGGPSATGAAVSLAGVYLAKHQFKDALAQAEKALAPGGADLYPYALIGDAYIEIGDYKKAEDAYSKMVVLAGPRYPHSRLSYLQFLKGDSEGALEQMKRAVGAAVEANLPKENLAWSQVQLGELFFHRGDIPNAEKAHRAALAAYPRYHRGLAGLAKTQSARKKYRDAIELYKSALAVIPLPEYAAALGDVYSKLGQAADAKKQYDLVEYIGHLNSLNKAIYNRELALFYADRNSKLEMAEELARKELDVRGDIYTYDVLAWTLYRNGKFRAAADAMKEALKLGTRDARLYFHAGMIHHGLGETARAVDFLAQALSTNRHFHLLQADVAARTLKQLRSNTQ